MADNEQITSTEAAAAAVEAVAKEETQATETTSEATETTEQTGSETTSSETGETRPSEAEVEQALNLYKALGDPNLAPSIIKVIAERYGVPLAAQAATPTKEEPKVPTAKDVLNHFLGPEYQFLGDKLAPAIEQYIQAQLAPVQQTILKNRIESEFEKANAALDKSTGGDFSKHEQEIVKLMDRIKPAEGVAIQDYLNDLYTLAKAGKGEKAISKSAAQKVVDKIQANSSERLPSPSAASELRLVKGPARPTLSESIAAAMRGEKFGA